MKLTKYKLGELIEKSIEKNSENKYTLQNLKGMSVNKNFIETKADMNGVSLSSYLIVRPEMFAYVTVTSRNSEKITLAYNSTNQTYIVSSSYVVFFIKNKEILLPEYLFMFFNRSEFDRYSRFDSWGSARETFSWEDMCDVEINLPCIEIQKKYVNIYNSMIENQRCYEKGLKELKFVCDISIEELLKKYPLSPIEPYILRQDIKNGIKGSQNVMGISTIKEFREPTSKVNKNELSNYKVVKPRQFGFVQTTHNEKVFAYALNSTNENIVISSVNEVFSVNEEIILSEYLAMFFNRTEFDRYARYHSWGSARKTFTWNDLVKVQIPIVDIKLQESIVNIYKVYKERKNINDYLKSKIKEICPILIKASIEATKKFDIIKEL